MIQTIFSIYKPQGVSSFFIIKQLRQVTGIRKIGHAGTLDPLAEGVLVIGITRFGTKQLHQLSQCDKEYLTKIKLGATTQTGDAESEEILISDSKPSLAQLKKALTQFEGEIWQTPHSYSAVKLRGRPAYQLARAGKQFELQAKRVKIYSLEILHYQYPIVELKAVVGSGVYIRSLTKDLGEQLGTGGYLTKLVRTRVGEYTMAETVTVEEFESSWKKTEINTD
jgi:tRNA pseudouridine55 synthase